MVAADTLNMRDSAGTSGTVVIQMPCGATVDVLEGPSTTPVAGWWRVRYVAPDDTPYAGWASGKFLVDPAGFDESTCGTVVVPLDGGLTDGGAPATDAGSSSTPVADIIDRAKLGVGYAYWYGHGGWRSDHTTLGSCTGSCPSCTHTGAYGADCSGFVSKVWQVPSASALAVDQHPYSTYEFYNDQTAWKQLDRTQLAPADALVRRSGSSGHMVLFESGNDPFGALWIYEARTCAAGVVHNLRSIDSTYRTIRRDGL